jgi:hypothetical protein
MFLICLRHFRKLKIKSPKAKLLWGTTIVILGGCSTGNVKGDLTCNGIDWYEAGRTDGVSGLPATKINEYKTTCDRTGAPVNVELYVNGREAGLVDFCSPTRAREAGRTGMSYSHVCPSYLEAAFLKGFESGLKLRVLENEHASIDVQIRKLARRINGGPEAPSARSEIDSLKAQLSRLDREISSLEIKSESL